MEKYDETGEGKEEASRKGVSVIYTSCSFHSEIGFRFHPIIQYLNQKHVAGKHFRLIKK